MPKQPVFKLNIGKTTEDEVQRSVEAAFSPFFVFRAPTKPDRYLTEVTDVLATWDDVALVIQVKSQAAEVGADSGRCSLRWARKNLAKASKQVKGAIRSIREGRVTHVENRLRGRVSLDLDDIKWLYGIIVLHHSSGPYDPFELVTDLQDVPVPIHVFSYRDFYNLSQLLDTPADLVTYLEYRSSVLQPTLHPKVHEEEGVFRSYAEKFEGLVAFRAEQRGEAYTEEQGRPYAEHLRRLLQGEFDQRPGQVIDHMISKVHQLDPSLGPITLGEVVVQPEHEASVRVATELSAIPRVRRIALGRRYLNTINQAAERGQDAWKSTHSPSRSDCMLFLASPLFRERRDERRRRLLVLTEMLKHHHQVNKAIGVATEAGREAGSSYDFLFLEGIPVNDPVASEAAREFFGEPKGLLREGHQGD